jgi:hypothetical protein
MGEGTHLAKQPNLKIDFIDLLHLDLQEIGYLHNT